MSGEKRAVADLSWEFTVGLVRGILIGSGIVRGRSCVGGRQAACWEQAEGGRELQGWEQGFLGGGGMLLLLRRCCDRTTHTSPRRTGSPC